MSRTNVRFVKTSKLLWPTYAVILALVLILPKPTRAQIDNTPYGSGALNSDTSGSYNSAFGVCALGSNTTGNENTAVGYLALCNNQEGGSNTAVGGKALYTNTGSYNTATGYGTLYLNSSGSQNTADGFKALLTNSTGGGNTAEGYEALYSNTIGNVNTAIGLAALQENTWGAANTATGVSALQENQTGGYNTANGYASLFENQSGSQNTAMGMYALFYSTGNYNIGIGYQAGSNIKGGSNNIDIGNLGTAGDADTIRIGCVEASDLCSGTEGTQTATYIAGIYGETAASGIEVYVDSSGQLGTKSSSARFKEAIKPMDRASEAILALKPVTFHYKNELDPRGIPQFGLVAEQVEKVNPDLVTRDQKGRVYSVRYEAVNAMLLNEFLKEHQRVQELQRRLDAMAAQMKEIRASLDTNGRTSAEVHTMKGQVSAVSPVSQ